MKILLTNDDGIDAIGLATLERAVKRLPGVTETIVVAPKLHQSGVSHQVTTDRPLRIEQVAKGWFAVDGTPSDCVRLGLVELASDTEWVFSGVNDGGNLGVDIHMSGTVAASREAAMMGCNAIAWSQYVSRPEPTDWEAAELMVVETWQRLQRHGLPRGGFWNVNFPHRPPVERLPQPVLCAPEPLPLPIAYHKDEENFRYAGKYASRPRTPGRDVEICFGGGISLSKLTAELS